MKILVAGVLMVSSAYAGREIPGELDRLLAAGRVNYSRGEYKTAREALEPAAKLARENPTDALQRYEIFKLLSRVLSATLDYKAAEPVLLEAINVKERELQSQPPDLIPDLTELAMLCRALKDYPRGLAVLDRVLQIAVQTEGPDGGRVADVLSHMGQFHLGLKEPEQAASRIQVALNIRQKLLGIDHVGILPEVDRLATVRLTLREYDRAEALYRRALLIRERALGSVDPDLIVTLDGLAYSCFGQKKYEDAELFYKRMLGIWELSAGPDHPLVALTLDKMVTFYREQKRMEEAQTAAGRAIAIRAHFLAVGLAEEAGEHLARGEKKPAEILYRRALQSLDAERPEHRELHKQVQASLDQLAPKPLPKRKKGKAPQRP